MTESSVASNPAGQLTFGQAAGRRPEAGQDIELLIPAGDEPSPEISLVIPAMNERITISKFVDWCKEGLDAAGVRGEILIADSSTDETPAIALEKGARVLRMPKRGLGRAYIDSIPYIRGRYVLMGDADCTYDFREIAGFVSRFRAGCEFVMGSRFKGYIEPRAMPKLHQYFGTPMTTQLLNLLYSTRFSDIHCGMRGITLDALVRLELESQGWEYASEMVLKSVCLGLRTAEVPVRFLKDQEGRLSHMKRGGWLEPWRAGWVNLRAMFLYHVDAFLLKPGLAAMALGLAITVPAALGPVTAGPITIMLHWMMLGLTATVLGLQSVYLGVTMQVLYGYRPGVRERILRFFQYDRMMAASGLLGLAGLAAVLPLASQYLGQGLGLPGVTWRSHLAVAGLMLLIAGFQTFSSTLVVHAVNLWARRREQGRPR